MQGRINNKPLSRLDESPSAFVRNIPPALRLVLIALLVAGVYFLSARLAFIFAYPNSRALLLWPPSAVLLLAMLFTPRRTWWTFILAALPAHLLAVSPPLATAYIAVLFYAGNVAESLVIALFMQRYNGGLPCFDNFRSTLLFVVMAAFLAPAIGSALVAAVVTLAGVQPGFGTIWQTRFLSYVVSMVMLVPPSIVLIETRGGMLRGQPTKRWVEAGVLALGYFLIAIFMLVVDPPQLQSLSVLLFLPLLLWGGVRFGVSGVSLGLLSTVLLSLWAASFERGPFQPGNPADNVLGLKVLVIEMGVPLILMAALLSERRNTIQVLEQTNAQVHQLAGLLINAQEEERRRVARELHDQVGQSLTMVKINLDTLRMGGHAPETQELLNEGSRLVDGALEQVRDLSVLLRPAMLDDLGLEPALRSLLNTQSRRSGFQVTFHAEGLQPRLPRETEVICYRIAQEALTNVARHAQARHVQLHVSIQKGQLTMLMEDDGVGFDLAGKQAEAAAGKSMGLLSMAERARLGGGELHMISAPGQGTQLQLQLPLHAAA
jgi:signal transduction histidine kinase